MSRILDHDLALATVLHRLGGEARELSALIERAEAALHAVLDGLTFLPIGVANDLQRIDLVRQSLDDFARLLSAAAQSMPTSISIPPTTFRAAVQLSDLAARLSGACPIGATSRAEEFDEPDLF